MKYCLLYIACLMMSLTTVAQTTHLDYTFKWGELPRIPDQFGFAGSFVGKSHSALIVAGGANFPDGGAPWTGSKKAWSDKIFVLDSPTGQWKLAGKLPQPMGYGVSISYRDQLICIGGSNVDGHSAKVYVLTYRDKKIKIDQLPHLPQPLANACGTVVGKLMYVAGGLLTPDAKTTANVFWSFNISDPVAAEWKKLETWPGPPRMLSVAGQSPKAFYLFSGTDLEDKNGTAHRHYLNDAYKYTPGKGWARLADLPNAVVATPGPALFVNKSDLLIFGGDDGKLADDAANLKEKHPGFSDKILKYNVNTDSWSIGNTIHTDKKADATTNPNGSVWAPVTTSLVIWKGYIVFPGGEVRPAVRTPRVLTAKFTHDIEP
jgi:N-acetylneuraminic acid mutarotase